VGIVLIRKIKTIIKQNEEIDFYLRLAFQKYTHLKTKITDDEKYIKKQYKSRLGKELNLENPILYNEKIQWLKLNYKNPLLKKCVDKYEVRDYVKSKTNANILIELYGIYNSIEEIDFEELPEKFVLKMTNGSGVNFVCHDKKTLNVKKLKRKINAWQKTNYYSVGREWAYKDVSNRIIVEKMIEGENGEAPRDYRIFCFDGKPRLIVVDLDSVKNGRKTMQYFRKLYDIDWNQIDATIQYQDKKDYIIDRPKKLDEMLKIATELSKDFPAVRVDLYYNNEEIHFGELTFYHASGYQKISPESFEKKNGRLDEFKRSS
jgi:hypothetical protein